MDIVDTEGSSGFLDDESAGDLLRLEQLETKIRIEFFERVNELCIASYRRDGKWWSVGIDALLIPLVIGDAKQLDGKKYRGKILFFFVIKSCYESLIFIDFINIFFESKFRVIFDKYYVSYFIFVICGNKFGLDSV